MHCQKFVEGDAAPFRAVAVFAYHLLLQWVQTHFAGARTTDTQWRHKSKKSENLDQCGRQNILWLYLKIWEWEWIFRPCSEGDFLTWRP